MLSATRDFLFNRFASCNFALAFIIARGAVACTRVRPVRLHLDLVQIQD